MVRHHANQHAYQHGNLCKRLWTSPRHAARPRSGRREYLLRHGPSRRHVFCPSDRSVGPKHVARDFGGVVRRGQQGRAATCCQHLTCRRAAPNTCSRGHPCFLMVIDGHLAVGDGALDTEKGYGGKEPRPIEPPRSGPRSIIHDVTPPRLACAQKSCERARRREFESSCSFSHSIRTGNSEAFDSAGHRAHSLRALWHCGGVPGIWQQGVTSSSAQDGCASSGCLDEYGWDPYVDAFLRALVREAPHTDHMPRSCAVGVGRLGLPCVCVCVC